VLSTASPTAKGATRRWTNVDDFAQEVADSRVWGGIHYRSSINAGLLLVRQIGQQAVRSFSGSP
jgi:hypothetical protein